MVNSDLFKFYSYFCVRGEKLCAHDDVVCCDIVFAERLLE